MIVRLGQNSSGALGVGLCTNKQVDQFPIRQKQTVKKALEHRRI